MISITVRGERNGQYVWIDVPDSRKTIASVTPQASENASEALIDQACIALNCPALGETCGGVISILGDGQLLTEQAKPVTDENCKIPDKNFSIPKEGIQIKEY